MPHAAVRFLADIPVRVPNQAIGHFSWRSKLDDWLASFWLSRVCCWPMSLLCSEVLSSLSVALGTSKATFSAAVDKTGRIYVEGAVKNNAPYLTKIGGFDVELSVQGSVLLIRQRDQPGIVGNVGMALAKGNINISFMTVCRTSRNEEAIMAIGIDDQPNAEVSMKVGQTVGQPGNALVDVVLQMLQCCDANVSQHCSIHMLGVAVAVRKPSDCAIAQLGRGTS
eukprot:GHRR01030662.1.p1 GENE.GHRR01030662.1~~GHRR01030662.1.p1  ORF type:complete len:236 (-),score=51.29 GHRR01030662.1:555-1226(-)